MSDINKDIDNAVKQNQEPEDKEVVELSKQNIKITKERNEERFFWILSFTVLLDILFLKDCENASLPVVVGILELIILLVLGQKLGIGLLSSLIDKMVGAFRK